MYRLFSGDINSTVICVHYIYQPDRPLFGSQNMVFPIKTNVKYTIYSTNQVRGIYDQDL